jgi:N6-adenosine-specific RNA methylase IME4
MIMVMIGVMHMAMIVAMCMTVLMPVVPQFGLVEQEEKNQANQQGQEQLVRPGLALKGLWQKVQKSGRHQGTGGQAQHVLGVSTEHAKTQPSGNPDAASAHQNRQ